jgi:hypothetical protein
MYTAFGFAHATAYHALRRAHRRLSADDGQGTVEYIGLILLLAGVMASVVSFGKDESLAKTIMGKVSETISNVGGASSKK